MNIHGHKIKNIIYNNYVLQTLALSLANACAMIFNFIPNLLLPQILGSHTYGIFSLVNVIITFFAGFLEFGIFASVARILLITDNAEKLTNIMAMAVKMVIGVDILLSGIIYFIGIYADIFFDESIGKYLVAYCYCSIACLLPYIAEYLFKAADKVYDLASFNIFSKFLYMIIILLGWQCNIITIDYCLIAFFISPIILFIIITRKYMFISVKNSWSILKEIMKINREFGIKNYLSRIISALSYNFNRILIGVFLGVDDVGFFSINMTLTNPIVIFSQSILAPKFKSFTNFSFISSKFIKNFFFFVCLLFIINAVCVNAIFLFFYNNVYPDAPMTIVWLIALSAMLQSMYIPYNEWLTANGRGNDTLVIAINYSIIGIIGNLIFIPLYGIYGAAYSLLIVQGYYLLHGFIKYSKLVQKK